jgi:hypothetical protein
MSNDFMKLLLLLFYLLAIYTYAKKNFGHLERNISERTQILNAGISLLLVL